MSPEIRNLIRDALTGCSLKGAAKKALGDQEARRRAALEELQDAASPTENAPLFSDEQMALFGKPFIVTQPKRVPEVININIKIGKE